MSDYCPQCNHGIITRKGECTVCGYSPTLDTHTQLEATNFSFSTMSLQTPQNVGRGWPGQEGQQRAVLLAPETVVRETPGELGHIVGIIKVGEEANLGKVAKADGKKWCQITLADNRQGYIPGDTTTRRLVGTTLNQKAGEMRATPQEQGEIIRPLARGDFFLILDTVKSDSGSWLKIRDGNGQEGFLDDKAKIESLNTKVQSKPEHDMLVGGLWCAGGILVTWLTYSAVKEGGGTYFIAWGAMLFGGIQFLKGLVRSIAS